MATKLVKNYAEALVDTLNQGVSVDVALANTKKYLAKRGHERILPSILKETVVKLESNETANQILVTVAKAGLEEASEVKALLANYPEASGRKVTLDETLVAGAVVTYKHQRLDASAKTKLINLYRRVTTK